MKRPRAKPSSVKSSRAAASRVAGEHARRGSAGSSTSKKPKPSLSLRGRLWIEIGSAPALTEAGADLLEQIEACGSLSEAARRLRFSYRRAWLLTNAMNRLWPEKLVLTAIGGQKGGGTQVTELGRGVLLAYRDLQVQLEHLLDQASEPFKTSTRSA